MLTKVHIVKTLVFFSSHLQMWELDYKQDWAPKNWFFRTIVLEKTFENPLYSKIKPVNPKENQPWILIGRTDAETEASIFWPHDVKSQIIRKDPDAGKDWGQEEKRVTEDEMVGWHHQLNGHEFEQTPGGSDGQRNLACYSPCSQKDSDTTEQLNNATWKQVCVCDVSTSRIDFGTIDFFLELLAWFFFFFQENKHCDFDKCLYICSPSI